MIFSGTATLRPAQIAFLGWVGVLIFGIFLCSLVRGIYNSVFNGTVKKGAVKRDPVVGGSDYLEYCHTCGYQVPVWHECIICEKGKDRGTRGL